MSSRTRIRGGPAWTHVDRYQIEAKAEGTPDRNVMLGPMMRALLEDRFQLKIRREVENGVAQLGLKLVATKGSKGHSVIDRVEKPSAGGGA
jgi:uncharacterized protein DUF3738